MSRTRCIATSVGRRSVVPAAKAARSRVENRRSPLAFPKPARRERKCRGKNLDQIVGVELMWSGLRIEPGGFGSVRQVGRMTDGEGPSIQRRRPNDYGFHITRLSSPRRKSMVRSTEHLRLTRSATGEIARLANSLLPGKLQSSSRTGND